MDTAIRLLALIFILFLVNFGIGYSIGYKKGRESAISDTRHVLQDEMKDKIINYKNQ